VLALVRTRVRARVRGAATVELRAIPTQIYPVLPPPTTIIIITII
jgi:hypothetical protein